MTELSGCSLDAADAEAFGRASEPSTLPVPDPTSSYWLATSADPTEADEIYDGRKTSPLSKEQHGRADVVIIGSGITGISAAYHLLHRADVLPDSLKSIVVLEARQFCSGATGRNGGHLTPVSALSYLDLASNPSHLCRLQQDADSTNTSQTDAVVKQILQLEQGTALKLIEIISANGKAEEVQLVHKRNWHLCFNPAEEATFEAALEAAKAAGLSDFVQQVRKVKQDECTQALHHPNGVFCAYEIPGAHLHPRRLVHLLWKLSLEAARKQGITLRAYTYTPVLKLNNRPVDVVLNLGPSQSVLKARYVLHATNAYASYLAPQLAGPNGIVPTRAQCVAALPTASSDQRWEMGMSLNAGYEYLQQRPTPAGQTSAGPAIFGGGRYLSETMEYDNSDDSTIHPSISAFLRSSLPSTFPSNFGTCPADVSHEWTGIIGMTRYKDPLVGPLPSSDHSVPVPSQYLSAGYSGHGMTRAFACAAIVADLIAFDANGQLDQWKLPTGFPACYLTMFPTQRT
ncbi:hypothetical protein OC846_000273 [Tilletia horrida]|uniref:FAD dependent oxidoreductase domain-containing protein n=1 Tax=Tilletia horrida TaxID=155126 RepID=A0AAN6JUN8_9BASI|nr:hypothetical protein OC845_002961 [Tilletia horrida]KAK0557706.1 hypothetical protein OC846_000273 [Tilletia horrida]KAK0570320.1 hypothetical protein OC861_000063 [Tilletia horrida]